MCGRYTLACPDRAALTAGLPFDTFSQVRIDFRPRYNIAPGQNSPIAHIVDGAPVLRDARWGFDFAGGRQTINARAETAAGARMFRDAFRQGRCLVPADGFFEWRTEGGVRQPYLFRRTDGALLLMAGLHEGGRYVVLTREATGDVAEIHHRMPVLLEPGEAKHWLSEGELAGAPGLTRTRVSLRVNRIDHDDPDCIAPAAQGSFDFD